MIHRIIYIALPMVLLTGCGSETTPGSNATNSPAGAGKMNSNGKPDSSVVSHSANPKKDDILSDNAGKARVFDAADTPLEEFASTACTGMFKDEKFNEMNRVEVMYEMTEDEKARRYRLEMSCMYSTINVDFSVPISIKSSAVSCLDLQKALSKVAVCNKATSIGDLKAYETDSNSWFIFENKNAEAQGESKCSMFQSQLNNNSWAANIGKTEFRGIGDLYQIQLEFDGIVSFTKFYTIGNKAITCPSGFNTKNVDALSAELHQLRFSIQNQVEGKSVVSV